MLLLRQSNLVAPCVPERHASVQDSEGYCGGEMINCKVNRKLLIYCLRVSNLEEKDYCQLFCCVKGDVTFMTSTCQLSHAGAYCYAALCLTRLGREQYFCGNSSHICIF